ncbi:MAG: hypothetical protein FJX25_02685 [Alphaproteobacteria bacterium]|nr:hypothetical protein [Alphaproteobacteria bacterium]
MMLLSLSEAHPHDEIRFWLFYLSFPPAKLVELEKFCTRLPNLRLHLVQVPDRQNFVRLSQLGGRPYGARFLWLVAHLHLPADMKRIIFLDPLDTLVTDDLVPFLHHPFAGNYVVACREIPSRPPLITAPARTAHARGASAAKILRVSKGVLNSGAIVINLERLRRDGIGISHYLEVGQWAREQMGLSFGDQGLFSLTHGSHYMQAHDRYNLRFFDHTTRLRKLCPAVIHFAGNIPKPATLRLSSAQEQQISNHMAKIGKSVMRITPRQIISPAFFPYYRRWWEVCARTPCHARIAPLAEAKTSEMLANLNLDPGRHSQDGGMVVRGAAVR